MASSVRSGHPVSEGYPSPDVSEGSVIVAGVCIFFLFGRVRRCHYDDVVGLIGVFQEFH